MERHWLWGGIALLAVAAFLSAYADSTFTGLLVFIFGILLIMVSFREPPKA